MRAVVSIPVSLALLHSCTWCGKPNRTVAESGCWTVGHGEAGSMTLLALPAEQGGHQSHLAAALTTSVQHLNQQKQLHAALQADLGSIGKCTLLLWNCVWRRNKSIGEQRVNSCQVISTTHVSSSISLIQHDAILQRFRLLPIL